MLSGAGGCLGPRAASSIRGDRPQPPAARPRLPFVLKLVPEGLQVGALRGLGPAEGLVQACRREGAGGVGEKAGLDQGEMPTQMWALSVHWGLSRGAQGGAEPGPAPHLQADLGLRPLAQLPRSHGHFKP